MATSYEKRHLPDAAWFHKRPSGLGAIDPLEDAILLEDDPGTETLFILLEDDPGTGTNAIALEGS